MCRIYTLRGANAVYVVDVLVQIMDWCRAGWLLGIVQETKALSEPNGGLVYLSIYVSFGLDESEVVTFMPHIIVFCISAYVKIIDDSRAITCSIKCPESTQIYWLIYVNSP